MSSVTTPPEQHSGDSQTHVVRVLVRWQDTHWSALIPDFTIAGP